jgi:mono/diheme cytochrome c family protein
LALATYAHGVPRATERGRDLAHCHRPAQTRRLFPSLQEGEMRFLATLGVLAIIAAVAAGAAAFGGYFNVSAMWEDPGPVAAALINVRSASIARHATDTPTVKLDDSAVIQAGAKAFAAQGCVMCHGGPGAPWAKFSEGLNPGPPDLKEVAPHLSAAEVFWVVKNGIRMTGMPSFAAAGVKDDDLWRIAAFVKALPKVSDADYKAWTAN